MFSLRPSSFLDQLITQIEIQLSLMHGRAVEPSVKPYLTSLSPSDLQTLTSEPSDLDGALLIHTNAPEDLEISVHMKKELLSHLDETHHFTQLADNLHGIQALFVLIEEISHFHQYLYSVEESVDISRFELELQAELDKIFVCAGLLKDVFGRCQNHKIIRINFDFMHFKSEMTRYKEASRLAEKFWKSHHTKLGDQLLQNQNFRNQLRAISNNFGQTKLALLEEELKLVA